jgi:hypothetical protein
VGLEKPTCPTTENARCCRVQSNLNVKMWKCSGRVLRNVLDIMSGLFRKVERRARKLWNTQKMIRKVDE